MSVFKSWSQVVTEAGQNTYDFISRVANELRKKECELWLKYPNQSIGGTPGLNGFTRAWFNDMCRDETPPVLNPPPFTGGQCCNLTYSAVVNQETRRCFNNDIISQQTLTPTLQPGAVKGLIYQACIQTPSLTCLDVVTEECDGTINYTTIWSATNGLASGACLTTNPFNPQANFVDPVASNDVIVSVTPTGGNPDVCGDPPPEYDPEPNIDPADLTFNITLNNLDGVDVNLQTTLIIENGDIEYSFIAPRTWNVNDIRFQMTFGGVTINSNNKTVNFGGGSGMLGDGSKHPLPSDITQPLPADDIPAPNAQNFEEEIKQPEDPKEEEVGVEIEYVKITVTSYPVNTKTFAGGEAPTIRWLGWFTWKSEGIGRGRQFIEFDDQVFYAPEGATGYAYYLYPGVQGFATVYKKIMET